MLYTLAWEFFGVLVLGALTAIIASGLVLKLLDKVVRVLLGWR